MAENFAEFCGKKAFEISYALLRVAGSSKNAAFSKHLENEAFNLLWASATGSYPQAILTASLLEYFVRLGREASCIGNTNADIILSELRTFKAAMKDIGNPATLPDSEVDLTGIFSKGGDGTDEIAPIPAAPSVRGPSSSFRCEAVREEVSKKKGKKRERKKKDLSPPIAVP